jgi:hypothetical protein
MIRYKLFIIAVICAVALLAAGCEDEGSYTEKPDPDKVKIKLRPLVFHGIWTNTIIGTAYSGGGNIMSITLPKPAFDEYGNIPGGIIRNKAGNIVRRYEMVFSPTVDNKYTEPQYLLGWDYDYYRSEKLNEEYLEGLGEFTFEIGKYKDYFGGKFLL